MNRAAVAYVENMVAGAEPYIQEEDTLILVDVMLHCMPQSRQNQGNQRQHKALNRNLVHSRKKKDQVLINTGIRTIAGITTKLCSGIHLWIRTSITRVTIWLKVFFSNLGLSRVINV